MIKDRPGIEFESFALTERNNSCLFKMVQEIYLISTATMEVTNDDIKPLSTSPSSAASPFHRG
jgi:hypothetical protein